MGRGRRIGFGVVVVALVVGLAGPAGAADSDHDGVGDRRDRCPTIPASEPDGCPIGKWRLRDANSAGPADYALSFSSLATIPVAGDWNGDDLDEVGTYDPQTGTWKLRDAICACGHNIRFHYQPGGEAGRPVVGDWNGDGADTIGIYVPSSGTWFLRNTNSAGAADIEFTFGGRQPGAFVRPVSGDFEGDGIETVGLYRADSNRWRLRNVNSSGPATSLFDFGVNGSSEHAVAGDWNNDGPDTVGVLRTDGTWFLRNTNSGGLADLSFSFGAGAHNRLPISGDWNGDSTDTIGVRRR